MCCVMPPASPSATFSLRIASRRDVLPWSTWPMTVTTGARGTRTPPDVSVAFVSAASAAFSIAVCWRESSSSSSNETTAASTPNSLAISIASFCSTGWLIVAKMPRDEKRLHEVLREDAQLLGELLDRDAFREEDGPFGLLLDLDDLSGLRGHRLLAGAALRGLGERLGREGLVRPLGRRRRDVLVRVLLVGAEVFPHVLFERGDLLRARLLRLGLLRVALLDARGRASSRPSSAGRRCRAAAAPRARRAAGVRSRGAGRSRGRAGPPGRGAKPRARREAGARREAARGAAACRAAGRDGHDGRRGADRAHRGRARGRDHGAAESAGTALRGGRSGGGAGLGGRRRGRGAHVRDARRVRAGARAVRGHLVAALLGRRRRRLRAVGRGGRPPSRLRRRWSAPAGAGGGAAGRGARRGARRRHRRTRDARGGRSGRSRRGRRGSRRRGGTWPEPERLGLGSGFDSEAAAGISGAGARRGLRGRGLRRARASASAAAGAATASARLARLGRLGLRLAGLLDDLDALERGALGPRLRGRGRRERGGRRGGGRLADDEVFGAWVLPARRAVAVAASRTDSGVLTSTPMPWRRKRTSFGGLPIIFASWATVNFAAVGFTFRESPSRERTRTPRRRFPGTRGSLLRRPLLGAPRRTRARPRRPRRGRRARARRRRAGSRLRRGAASRRSPTVAKPAASNAAAAASSRPGTSSSAVPRRCDAMSMRWSACATSALTACSLLISMRAPIRAAARRTFWPRFPIARESWSSSTMHSSVGHRLDGLAVGADLRLALVVGGHGRHARDLRGGERVLRVRDEVVRVLDDVDALAAQLAHDRLHARAAHADAGADRVHVALARGHGHLRAVAGLADAAADHDGAVVDLGDFHLHEAHEELGRRAREDDLRALRVLVDVRRGRRARARPACSARRATGARAGSRPPCGRGRRSCRRARTASRCP